MIHSYFKLFSSIWETVKKLLEEKKPDIFHFLKILNWQKDSHFVMGLLLLSFVEVKVALFEMFHEALAFTKMQHSVHIAIWIHEKVMSLWLCLTYQAT